MEILLERIKELCKSRSITVTMLETKLGFPKNTIYQWKKRVPGTEKIQSVADFFGVSIDYLLGRTDNKAFSNDDSVSDADLEELLDKATSWDGTPITEKDKEAVRNFLKGRKS